MKYLAPMKYLKYVLSDMPRSVFLEHPEYLDDYLPWNPMVKKLCQQCIFGTGWLWWINF